jgi:hypothetical protein
VAGRSRTEHRAYFAYAPGKTGAEIRVVSDNLTASAEYIVALHKRRWAIELLFRWISPGTTMPVRALQLAPHCPDLAPTGLRRRTSRG